MSCHPNIADPLILHHPKSFFAEIMKLTPLPPKKKKKKKIRTHQSINEMILNLKFFCQLCQYVMHQ